MRSIMDFDKLFDEKGRQATIFTAEAGSGDYSRTMFVEKRKNMTPASESISDISAIYDAPPLVGVAVGECYNFTDTTSLEAKHRFFSTMTLFALALLSVIALSILL